MINNKLKNTQNILKNNADDGKNSKFSTDITLS